MVEPQRFNWCPSNGRLRTTGRREKSSRITYRFFSRVLPHRFLVYHRLRSRNVRPNRLQSDLNRRLFPFPRQIETDPFRFRADLLRVTESELPSRKFHLSNARLRASDHRNLHIFKSPNLRRENLKKERSLEQLQPKSQNSRRKDKLFEDP